MTGPIERIVVSLDTASETDTAIDTAARLAARVKAPLHAVFVEDEELLHLAALPFARQVTLGAGAQPFTTEDIELQMRAAAARTQRELVVAAEVHRVECTFEIVRGASELAISSASERDLFVAGARTRPVAGHFRMSCRWWSSIGAGSGPFLLTCSAADASGAVVVLLHEPDEAAQRLLDAAAQVAAAKNHALTVIHSPSIAREESFDKWIAEHLKDHPVPFQIEVAPFDPTLLDKQLADLHCRVLAFDARLAERNGNQLREIAERLACDVLLVR